MSPSDTTTATDESLSTIPYEETRFLTLTAIFDVSDLWTARVNYLESKARELERGVIEAVDADDTSEPIEDPAWNWQRERVGLDLTLGISHLSPEEREQVQMYADRIEREMAAEVAKARVLAGDNDVEA